jgi:phosphoribosylamine--glycine ligase
LSHQVLVAGRVIVPLEPTQDHKRVGDGDTGPNTGGMGAYCPAPLATPELLAQIDAEVMVPIVHAMKRGFRTEYALRRKQISAHEFHGGGWPFRGVLYAGLMIAPAGPRVLEFNCRLGDPETQPMLMRLKTDLLDVLEAVVDDRLGEAFPDGLEWDPRSAVCVVMCSRGYPGPYRKGEIIEGLGEAAKLPGVKVFHAGTRRDGERVFTDGGRVLGVTALGDSLADARANTYAAVAKIDFLGAHYRSDIAARAL